MREWTGAEIARAAKAFQESRILLTAFELGVFPLLEGGGASSEEVAKALSADPRATDRLLNALTAMELTVKEGGVFRNTPAASRHLTPGGPAFLGGLGHTSNVFRAWSGLTEAVLSGRPPQTHTPMAKRRPEFFRAFLAAMHERARQGADEVVRAVGAAGVRRVLDVGGGSGIFSMAFARAEPGLTAVVFDLPEAAAVARRYIEAEAPDGRVTVREGDFSTDDLGAGFDLVFVSAIVHMLSPEGVRALLGKCRAALVPGGRVVIRDFIMEEDRTSPAIGAVFALNMLVNTEAGDTYTWSELGGWLRETGFGEARRIEAAGDELLAAAAV